MPTESGKPLIVISYAHADEPEHPAEGEVKWLSFVTGYLRPAIKHGAVDLWLDRLMLGGADWEREIGEKLRACDIFILLVSRHSLSSDYVVDKEIALIRNRQANGEAIHFYPLILTPTPKIALDLVRAKNLRPRDGTPFSDYSLNDRYRHMSNAADEIAKIAEEIAGRRSPPLSASASSNVPPLTLPNKERGVAGLYVPSLYIKDQASLEVWLKAQSRQTVIAIAARAALRVAPLGRRRLMSVIFRATSLARLAAKYPTRAHEFGASTRAAVSAAAADPDFRNYSSTGNYSSTERCNRYDGYGDLAATSAATRAAAAAAFADHSTAAQAAAAAVGQSCAAANGVGAWEAVLADLDYMQSGDIGAACDMPLWPAGEPEWARVAWTSLRVTLPGQEDWEVWFDWYEGLWRGGSRNENYEYVFASAPWYVWQEGPTAANAWIKAHLPKSESVGPSEPSLPLPDPSELPPPLPGLDAPFAYSWNLAYRVATVAGAQNLPDYRHFSSEDDHRRALEAARVGGERLLKALRDGRYNARPEYGEALEYYLADLPKTAGAGNILLANDQVRILHAMFLADAAMLPEGLASRLKSVIANQFALNAFYDLVERHNEAVNAGNWSNPFPLDEAKKFFGAVEDNTPRWFEPHVEQGLRQVEQAEPPPVATLSEPASRSAIGPPPLPPGTPDARDSWKRQMATAANALWETFLQGQKMPVAQEEWRQTAHTLGVHVGPVIDFLRAQEETNGAPPAP